MPATYTHNKFSKDVYKRLDKSIQNLINKSIDYYEVFSQSFDNLFFYNALSLKKGKAIRDLGHYAHKNNVNLYFKNIIDYIRNNNLTNNSYILSYLYGSINHYILDSYIHPFVFYKTGVFKKDNKDTHKYNGLHTKFEFMLDSLLYNMDTNLEYKKFDGDKVLLKKLIFPTDLLNTIDYTFSKTFNIDNIGTIYNKSSHDYINVYKYGFKSKYGIKKKLYTMFDKLTGPSISNTRYYSTNVSSIDPSILNLKKDTWNHPCDKNITYNDSLFDLYEKAVNKSVDIINKINLYFSDSYDYNKLLIDIGDNSYISALPLNKNKPNKYFEF